MMTPGHGAGFGERSARVMQATTAAAGGATLGASVGGAAGLVVGALLALGAVSLLEGGEGKPGLRSGARPARR